MTHLHLEPFGGISGDMFLSALVDLGFPIKLLQEALSSFIPPETIAVEEVVMQGIRGRRLKPHPQLQKPWGPTLEAMKKAILSLTLPAEVQEKTLKALELLFTIEAHIHGGAPEKIHLHELARLDTLLDLVGAFWGLHYFGVTHLTTQTIPLGEGAITTQHGTLPLPAPATIALLKGLPLQVGKGEGECTTPTGAVILKVGGAKGAPYPTMVLQGVGYGFGTKAIPGKINGLRLLLGEREMLLSSLWVVETQMDDIPGEMVAYGIEKLFDLPIKDALWIPVGMKKSRPGVILQVLVEEAHKEKVMEALFHHTSTLGCRAYPVERWELSRKGFQVATRAGKVEVKVGYWKEKPIQIAPEFESLRALAQTTGIPFKELYMEALAAGWDKVKKEGNDGSGE